MIQSNQKGNVAVLEVIKYLQNESFHVFTEPFSQSSKVDLIALKDNKILKIQIKYITARRGIVLLNTKVKSRYIYGPEDIDYFAIYEPISKKILWVPIGIVAEKKKFYIRLRNAKTNNYKKLNSWRNYKDLTLVN